MQEMDLSRVIFFRIRSVNVLKVFCNLSDKDFFKKFTSICAPVFLRPLLILSFFVICNSAYSSIEPGVYYVHAEKLNVRSSPQADLGRENVLGALGLNDQVEVLANPHLLNQPAMTEIRILNAKNRALLALNKRPPLFVASSYLNKTPYSAKPLANRYFVIQNIASERTRVYERCLELDCPHRLVFEAPMVVGKPKETGDDQYDYVTRLGHAKISEWIKFYQDGNATYPHWYKAGQSLTSIPPKAPRDSKGRPEASIRWGRKWLQKNAKGEESIYGAFGWFAAKVHPADAQEGMAYQWLHGTIGWASDGLAPIELSRSTLLNIFAKQGSSGCTRLSNGDISYLREILPVGTDVYRVYAREATRRSDCLDYNFFGKCSQELPHEGYSKELKAWPYIMLTHGAQMRDGLSADAEKVKKTGLSIDENNLIEQGVLYLDAYPNPVFADYTRDATSGESGDPYRIDSEYGDRTTNFRGVYLVDEGRFIEYRHPNPQKSRGKIKIAGLKEFREKVPDFMNTSGSFYMEDILYQFPVQDDEERRRRKKNKKKYTWPVDSY